MELAHQGKFKCTDSTCEGNFAFSSEKQLKTHTADAHTPALPCPRVDCPYVCTSEEALSAHMTYHANAEKPKTRSCDLCGRTKSSRWTKGPPFGDKSGTLCNICYEAARKELRTAGETTRRGHKSKTRRCDHCGCTEASGWTNGPPYGDKSGTLCRACYMVASRRQKKASKLAPSKTVAAANTSAHQPAKRRRLAADADTEAIRQPPKRSRPSKETIDPPGQQAVTSQRTRKPSAKTKYGVMNADSGESSDDSSGSNFTVGPG
jgi:hypothetical protein